jgi:hypothetical protein
MPVPTPAAVRRTPLTYGTKGCYVVGALPPHRPFADVLKAK